MRYFPFLLFQYSSTLFPDDCWPDFIDCDRMRYEGMERPFRLEVARYHDELSIRKLFVRSELRWYKGQTATRRQKVGSGVVWALQQLCREENLRGISVETVLSGSRGFWKHHGFQLDDYGGYWRNLEYRKLDG